MQRYLSSALPLKAFCLMSLPVWKLSGSSQGIKTCISAVVLRNYRGTEFHVTSEILVPIAQI